MSAKPTYEELEKKIQALERQNPGLAWSQDITDCKAADGELRASEDRYRTVLETIDEGMVLQAASGEILTWNKGAESIFGIPAKDVVGKASKGKEWQTIRTDGSKYEGKDHPSMITLQTGQSFRNEIMGVYRPSGELRWISINTNPIFSENRAEPFAVAISFSDITERKQNEQELENNEALFRGIFDNMTSGSAIYEVLNDGSNGADYIVKSFNNKSLEIEGKTLAQVVGKSLFDLRPNIDDFGLIPVMKKVWESGESGYFPVKMYQDEKFSNYYENLIFKIPSGEVVTIYNDVTSQKNAELELKNSEERFNLAMNFVNDGIYDWNLETNQIYYSPGWKRMLGYEDHEIKNEFSAWERLTRPEDVGVSWEMLNELLEKKRDRFELEFKMKHKKGHWVDILSRANAVFDETGKGVRVLGTHVDITEKKRLQEQLQQTRKMESIGNLAGGIAHDFNNILASMIGFTELALDDAEKGSGIEDSLHEIFSAGKRARELVKQILAFARQSNEEKKPIQVNLVAKEALKLIRATIPASIKIRSSIGSNSVIMASPTQIHQLFMNLCTNAAQAMEANGGILEVGLQDVASDDIVSLAQSGLEPDSYMKVSISDTGSGIAPDILPSIFEPFFTTKGVGEGTGMGLAVVHGIVESNGGKIFVDSEPGRGTVFSIYLPVTKKRDSVQPYDEEQLPSGTERILFVDDELPIAKMGSQILERLGYSVTTRTSSVEALELFRAKPNEFKLVITDMTMPEMTGDKLAVEMMKIRPDIPVIICTGYSNKISDEIAANIGIKAFANKPMAKADLAKTVRKVLDD